MSLPFFLLGLCVGSFLSVLADRLPKEEDVLWTRSHCDHCHKTLAWFELIPLVSFFVQQGKCRRCDTKLSLQYPLVEIVTAVGFLFLYNTPLMLGIFCVFLVIFISDLKYQIIPDSMTLILLVLSAIYSGLALANIASGLSSALFFYLLWLVTKGRGMGFGDVKLAGVLGLMLGFPRIVFALYGAFLTGAAVGVILIFSKQKSLKSKIAFGPFLILGTIVSIVFESQLTQLWQRIF